MKVTNGESGNELDPIVVKTIKGFFSQIPFNQVLGIEDIQITKDHVKMKVPMRPELVGNFLHGILHGGVISAVLDVAGGCVALIGTLERIKDLPDEEKAGILSKIGTIDLRVDYLRPGKGEWYYATGRLLRTGNKVAVSRMEFHDHEDTLLAVGTGTYLCG